MKTRYFCDYCDRSFDTITECYEHEKEEHPQINDFKIINIRCDNYEMGHIFPIQLKVKDCTNRKIAFYSLGHIKD